MRKKMNFERWQKEKQKMYDDLLRLDQRPSWQRIIFPFREIPFEPKYTKYFRVVVNGVNAFGFILLLAFIVSIFLGQAHQFFIPSLLLLLFYVIVRRPYASIEKDLKHIAIDMFEAEGKWQEAIDIKNTLGPDDYHPSEEF